MNQSLSNFHSPEQVSSLRLVQDQTLSPASTSDANKNGYAIAFTLIGWRHLSENIISLAVQDGLGDACWWSNLCSTS